MTSSFAMSVYYAHTHISKVVWYLTTLSIAQKANTVAGNVFRAEPWYSLHKTYHISDDEAMRKTPPVKLGVKYAYTSFTIRLLSKHVLCWAKIQWCGGKHSPRRNVWFLCHNHENMSINWSIVMLYLSLYLFSIGYCSHINTAYMNMTECVHIVIFITTSSSEPWYISIKTP